MSWLVATILFGEADPIGETIRVRRQLLERWQLDSNQLLVKFQYALRY